MRLGLKPVAQPVLACDGHVQDRRAQVNERHIETAPVEGDDVLVFSGHVPETAEQFRLLRARHEFHRLRLVGVFPGVVRRKQHLAAGGLGVEHGNAHHPRGKRPEVELLSDFGAPGLARAVVGKFFRIAKEVFLLGAVEVLSREGGGLDVKNQSGHARLRGNSPRTTRTTGPTHDAGTCRPPVECYDTTTSFFCRIFSFSFLRPQIFTSDLFWVLILSPKIFERACTSGPSCDL